VSSVVVCLCRHEDTAGPANVTRRIDHPPSGGGPEVIARKLYGIDICHLIYNDVVPSPSASTLTRPRDLDEVAAILLVRTSRLARLLNRMGTGSLTRTESCLLGTVSGGQRTINELAETEALTQPAVSKLVDRLERRELVVRRRSERDARVVLVTITAAGSAALKEEVDHLRSLMRETLSELPAGDIATLFAADDVFESLIQHLHAKVTTR
jgi:DNA-binding MarR family transcriptional regulator